RTVEDVRGRAEPLALAQLLRSNLSVAAEVPFESPSLRIRGRFDLVEIEKPNNVRITDFKSGSVADEEGLLNDETATQLRLYGLALIELVPNMTVSLRVISRDGESEVSFGELERLATTEWLSNIIELLPAGIQVDAES